VADLHVRPHDLATYDELARPRTEEQGSDEDES